jgi:hypothetical protein
MISPEDTFCMADPERALGGVRTLRPLVEHWLLWPRTAWTWGTARSAVRAAPSVEMSHASPVETVSAIAASSRKGIHDLEHATLRSAGVGVVVGLDVAHHSS